jgi:hypothetical protein
MAETTAQLKRKRESAIGLQKKAKKPRKGDALAGQDAAPVAEPTPEPQATPQAQDKPKAASRKAANSVRDQDEDKLEEPKAQTTSLRSVSQDTETSTKKSFQEKVLESKDGGGKFTETPGTSCYKGEETKAQVGSFTRPRRMVPAYGSCFLARRDVSDPGKPQSPPNLLHRNLSARQRSTCRPDRPRYSLCPLVDQSDPSIRC